MNPSKGDRPPFTLRMPVELQRELEVHCAKLGIDRNTAICEIVAAAVKNGKAVRRGRR